MRPEIERLLKLDWSAEGLAADDHVRSIVAKRLSPSERQELCQVMRESDDHNLVQTVSGVMEADHHPEYHEALKDALKSSDLRIAKEAVSALAGARNLGSAYPGYLELLFSNEQAQQALGDDFAFVLSGRGSELTGAMRAAFLQMFCERFGHETPRLDAMTAPWFRMLAELGETNDKVARILVRIWHQLRPSDSHNKYLVLLAMSVCPHPSYKPILRTAAKSKIEDLRELGECGLGGLSR
jgi:hypothetical protein